MTTSRMNRRWLGASAVFMAVALLTWCSNVAAQGAAPSPPSAGASSSPASLWGIGLLLGYFLAYSINHGSKSQDVYKSLLGILGISAGGGGALWIKDPSAQAIGSYSAGALIGFLIYAGLSLILTILYSVHGEAFATPPAPPASGTGGGAAPTLTNERGMTLFADLLGRVLLGEDFRTPPPKS